MENERVKKLCETFGVSSAETDVKQIVKKEMVADSYKMDRLNSLFGLKESKNPNAKTLMIACPLDEVGFMVSEIKKDGTLAFIPLESLKPSTVLYQKAIVQTRFNTYIQGVFTNGKNALEGYDEPSRMDDICIDCGLSYEEAKEMITPGDLVGYAPAYTMENDTIISKALFPRALEEVIISLSKRIKDKEYDYTIALGMIGQSIVGFRGTQTSTYVIQPDAAIALTAFQADNLKTKLGCGTVCAHYDKQMLPSQKLLHAFDEVVHPTPSFQMMGNDGSFIHKTLSGCPSIALGIPMRNVGSANEMCCIKDIDKLVDDIELFLDKLNSKEINNIGFGEDNG